MPTDVYHRMLCRRAQRRPRRPPAFRSSEAGRSYVVPLRHGFSLLVVWEVLFSKANIRAILKTMNVRVLSALWCFSAQVVLTINRLHRSIHGLCYSRCTSPNHPLTVAHSHQYCQIQPLTGVDRSVNQPVIIRLKWGQTEYHGRLISVDSYMNIQLSSTEEYIDGKNTGQLGQVLIRYAFRLAETVEIVLIVDRCNNVLWISGDNGTKQEDVKMEG